MLIRTTVWLISNFGITIVYFFIQYQKFKAKSHIDSLQLFAKEISNNDIIVVALLIVILTLMQFFFNKKYLNICEVDEETGAKLGNKIPNELNVECSTFKRNYRSILEAAKKNKNMKIAIDGKIMYEEYLFTKYRKRKITKLLESFFFIIFIVLIMYIFLAIAFDFGKLFCMIALVTLLAIVTLAYFFEVI